MDVLHEPPPRSDADRRVIAGWAALEQGDIEEARAALSDVYAVAPTHPALPLLAAGIRRIRPRRFPWRGVFLLLIVIAGGAFVVYSRVRPRAAQVDHSPAVASAERPQPEAPVATPPPQPSTAAPAAAPHASVTGTSGSSGPAIAPPVPEPNHPTGTEDAQIRQAIARFATAYSNRWTPLTFSSCDIARGEGSAIVTCQSRGVTPSGDGAGGATWTFSCRKIDETWKIVSMQPPAESRP